MLARAMRRPSSLLIIVSLGFGCRAEPPAPDLLRATSFSPGEGHPAGGTVVMIDGQGFDPKATANVFFGQNASKRVHVVTATRLQAELPPGTAGQQVSVRVEQKGRGSATAEKPFRYFSDKEIHDHGGHH